MGIPSWEDLPSCMPEMSVKDHHMPKTVNNSKTCLMQNSIIQNFMIFQILVLPYIPRKNSYK
jgi:hypothetical protein